MKNEKKSVIGGEFLLNDTNADNVFTMEDFDSDQKIESKVPILGDIPLIKKLFRSSDKDKEQRELLIFITPTVVTNKI